MPDHLHLLVWPHGQATTSEIMQAFKSYTARRIVQQAEAERAQVWLDHFHRAGDQPGRGKSKVWQDSFWDKNIYTEHFLRQKLNYVHRNPLRAGLVENPEDYPYSSYRNYVFDEHWLIEVDCDWVNG